MYGRIGSAFCNRETWKNIFFFQILVNLEEIYYLCSMNEDKKKKLAELKTGSQHLAEKYGEKGTPSRE
jgi:hypothetical protein